MIFFDKSATCERTGDKKYGWAPKEEPAVVYFLFKRLKHWSILPAYTMNRYIAFTMHSRLIRIEIFNQFVADQVLLQYTLYVDRDPQSILILDNAKIHMLQKLEYLYKATRVLLARLLPYSCDYNPIETSFTLLKRWIKKHAYIAEAYGPNEGGF